MKTKFIKISVQERLPEKEGRYFIWVDNPNARNLNSEKKSAEYNMERHFFKDGEFKTFYDTTHYLEEVPDREEQIIERLNSLIHHIELFTKGNIGEQEYFENEIKSAKKLLNELKQTT